MHINALHEVGFQCLVIHLKNKISNKNVKFAIAVKYCFIKLVILFFTQSLLL